MDFEIVITVEGIRQEGEFWQKAGNYFKNQMAILEKQLIKTRNGFRYN